MVQVHIQVLDGKAMEVAQGKVQDGLEVFKVVR